MATSSYVVLNRHTLSRYLTAKEMAYVWVEMHLTFVQIVKVWGGGMEQAVNQLLACWSFMRWQCQTCFCAQRQTDKLVKQTSKWLRISRYVRSTCPREQGASQASTSMPHNEYKYLSQYLLSFGSCTTDIHQPQHLSICNS